MFWLWEGNLVIWCGALSGQWTLCPGSVGPGVGILLRPRPRLQSLLGISCSQTWLWELPWYCQPSPSSCPSSLPSPPSSAAQQWDISPTPLTAPSSIGARTSGPPGSSNSTSSSVQRERSSMFPSGKFLASVVSSQSATEFLFFYSKTDIWWRRRWTVVCSVCNWPQQVAGCGLEAPVEPATTPSAPETPETTPADTTPSTVTVTYRPAPGSPFQCSSPGPARDEGHCNKFWLCREDTEGVLEVRLGNQLFCQTETLRNVQIFVGFSKPKPTIMWETVSNYFIFYRQLTPVIQI